MVPIPDPVKNDITKLFLVQKTKQDIIYHVFSTSQTIQEAIKTLYHSKYKVTPTEQIYEKYSLVRYDQPDIGFVLFFTLGEFQIQNGTFVKRT